MKRDMDLIRDLLLEIEAMPPGSVYDSSDSTIEGEEPIVIREHMELLQDAAFLKGCFAERSGISCAGLTWQGHDFLAAARTQSVWNEAKKTLREKAMTVPIAVLSQLLVKIASRQLGL